MRLLCNGRWDCLKIVGFVFISTLLIAILIYTPDNGRLIDLEELPENVVYETVCSKMPWYIITVPSSGKWRQAVGVYYFGEKLPRYFHREGKKVVVDVQLEEGE